VTDIDVSDWSCEATTRPLNFTTDDAENPLPATVMLAEDAPCDALGGVKRDKTGPSPVVVLCVVLPLGVLPSDDCFFVGMR